jgi:NADPH:quinone reductase
MSTMQAVKLTKKGGPEVLERFELPLPEPGPGEVRVKIHATGVGAPGKAQHAALRHSLFQN